MLDTYSSRDRRLLLCNNLVIDVRTVGIRFGSRPVFSFLPYTVCLIVSFHTRVFIVTRQCTHRLERGKVPTYLEMCKGKAHGRWEMLGVAIVSVIV